MLGKINMALVWVLVAITSSVLFFGIMVPVWLLTVAFDKRLYVLHRFSSCWALLYIYGNPFWKVRMHGRENIVKGQRYVVVVNHQSSLDIPLMYRLPLPFKWVSKAEVFKVPVVGWNLWINRHIGISRGNAISARHMVEKCVASLGDGNSILIFPEGTRSRNGKMNRFKEGAFLVAREARVPILPVVVHGTSEALPRDAFVAKRRQTFTITVLPPIPTEVVEQKSAVELSTIVREQMVEIHKQWVPEYYS
ncbi:MAG TPA: lysophospholipid acyltransferase family protein [Williamwhitmania sp.]|nr:lysophospholipid acyltransferase family protein [Williamwhitmania sp.]